MEASPDGMLERWNDALTALQLLQLAPDAWGGIVLRAPHGPVRDLWLDALRRLGLPLVKLPASADPQRLHGGLDLARTLETGRMVHETGLLARAAGGLVCVPMAEGLAPALAAPLAQALDAAPRAGLSVVALDESLADEPGVPAPLAERLAIWIDLEPVSPALLCAGQDRGASAAVLASGMEPLTSAQRRRAQDRLAAMSWDEAQVRALCAAAAALGIDSLRVPVLAWRVAQCHAALAGRTQPEEDDLAYMARTVLAPRSTRALTPPNAEAQAATPAPADAPSPEEAQGEPDSTPPDPSNGQDHATREDVQPPTSPEDTQALEDAVLAAVLASLPPHVLDALATRRAPQAGRAAGRSGQAQRGAARGRPLPPRPGQPAGAARLHVLATLRAAVPRQRLRTPRAGCRIALRAEDFHVQRFEQRSASCLVLALDASGSAALQRLAEAKGAVELLLEQSYARRDSVCIIAFRGAQASLLLPVTRSLVRARRAMTGLPGGGGTPLASALQLACVEGRRLQRQGVTPILVCLSDGRANVDLQGRGGRAQARADALLWARQWGQTGQRALWIDTALQPEPLARELAGALGADYLPMPQVQAQRMAQAVRALGVPP